LTYGLTRLTLILKKFFFSTLKIKSKQSCYLSLSLTV